jgi:hypothetical protein
VKLSEEQARAILREYPDADLSAFEVEGDVDSMAAEEVLAFMVKLGLVIKPDSKGCIVCGSTLRRSTGECDACGSYVCRDCGRLHLGERDRPCPGGGVAVPSVDRP